MKKAMKVEIIISEGHNYCKTVNNGAPFTSVDYMASTYGGGSPCDNEDEIQSALKHAKSVIRSEGDIPVVVDQRKRATLQHWF